MIQKGTEEIYIAYKENSVYNELGYNELLTTENISYVLIVSSR